MESIFLDSSLLGKLRIINIYEDYDGPRLFSAENEIGTTFFVYWTDSTDSADEWYLIPVSKTKLAYFEKGQFDILNMLTKQEQATFFKAVIQFNDNKSEVDVLPRESITSIDLPDKGIYVDVNNIVVASTYGVSAELTPTHELRVAKSNKNAKKNVLLEHVTRVCEKFSELADSFNMTNKIDGDFQPLNARYGSFIISLHASEITKFEDVLFELSNLMINKKDIRPYLKSNDIDVKSFSSLLEAIISTSVNFELKSKLEDDRTIIIYKSDAVKYFREISGLSLQYVSTHQVPQADDLQKVFKIIDMKWNGDDVTPESLKVDKRHVGYYQTAAIQLGFLATNGSLTSLGHQIASADAELRLRITARCFESSDCGWAWINWSGAKDLTEIDPSTAEAFLLASCSGLSLNTANRRARTLTRWCRELKESYSPW